MRMRMSSSLTTRSGSGSKLGYLGWPKLTYLGGQPTWWARTPGFDPSPLFSAQPGKAGHSQLTSGRGHPILFHLLNPSLGQTSPNTNPSSKVNDYPKAGHASKWLQPAGGRWLLHRPCRSGQKTQCTWFLHLQCAISLKP